MVAGQHQGIYGIGVRWNLGHFVEWICSVAWNESRSGKLAKPKKQTGWERKWTCVTCCNNS